MKEFIHVIDAQYIDEHRVWLRFNDGYEGEVNLQDQLRGKVFEPLTNIEYFKQFKIEGHTLSWPNGADFSPEFLRDNLQNPSMIQVVSED